MNENKKLWDALCAIRDVLLERDALCGNCGVLLEEGRPHQYNGMGSCVLPPDAARTEAAEWKAALDSEWEQVGWWAADDDKSTRFHDDATHTYTLPAYNLGPCAPGECVPVYIARAALPPPEAPK